MTPYPFSERSNEWLNENEIQERKEWGTQEKHEKEQIKKGYTRVREKIKEIRQHFSQAVTSGRRCDGGKMALEFYDELTQIWGGSPATEPLRCDTSSESATSSQNESDGSDEHDDDGEEESNWNGNSDLGTTTSLNQQRKVRKYLDNGIFITKSSSETNSQ